MKLKEITKALEKWAPLSDAENFDNVGLLIGQGEDEITKALVTLDVTDEVMEEGISKKADLIITFHPLIFSGLKRLSGNSRIEKLVVKAIQNKIAVYAVHTNLDAQLNGVNGRICQELGLKNCQILIPKEDNLLKLVFFAPEEDVEKVKSAIFATGAGYIGNYAECSFTSEGTGQFMPVEGADPTKGNLYELYQAKEFKVEILVEKHLVHKAIAAMKEAHSYEEVAFDLVPLANRNQTKGMGQIGELETPLDENDFLKLVKNKLLAKCVRHSALTGRKIKKVAVLGGSGAFGIAAAKAAGADAFVTADLKYHDFFTAENQILLCDAGHFESEQFTKNHITHYLSENFPNFAVLTSEVNTNPINYYI